MKSVSKFSKSVSLVAALLAFVVLLPTCVMGKQRTAQPNKEKLRLAEQARDEFMRRFYETLDFGVPFNEQFVADPALRLKGLEPFSDPFLDLLLGRGAAERLYISSMNVWFTRLAYWVARGNKLPPEIEAAGGSELFPVGDLKLDVKDSREIIQTKLENCIATNNRLATMFRKYLPRGESAYKAGLKRIKEESVEAAAGRPAPKVPRIERGSERLGLSKAVPVYVVQREAGNFYYIEKGGALKIVYISVLGDFSFPFL